MIRINFWTFLISPTCPKHWLLISKGAKLNGVQLLTTKVPKCQIDLIPNYRANSYDNIAHRLVSQGSKFVENITRPVNFPDEGTYLNERQRSPRYWLLPSSTGTKSFHSSIGPARSTEFNGSWYSPNNND